MFGARVVALVLTAAILAPFPCLAAASGQAQHADERRAFERWLNGAVRFLLTDKEARLSAALSRPAQFEAFRRWFWERRDPTPGTAHNEFRDEFNARVAYANKEFGGRNSEAPGALTPKGVIYVVLGAPKRIATTTGRRFEGDRAQAVEVWNYDFDDAPDLQVPFIATPEGDALVSVPGRPALRQGLERALHRVSESAVRNRDIPFTRYSLLVDATSTPSLPALSRLHRSTRGIDGQFSIPLSELYGRPEGEALHVALQLEAYNPATGLPQRLGEISVTLRPEDFSRWPGRTLRVAFWLPTDAPIDLLSGVTVSEVVTGRTARLVAGPEPTALAYRVESILGSAELAGGEGAAYAFIEHTADATDTASTMWLERPPHSLAGDIVEQPVEGLRLVRLSSWGSGATIGR